MRGKGLLGSTESPKTERGSWSRLRGSRPPSSSRAGRPGQRRRREDGCGRVETKGVQVVREAPAGLGGTADLSERTKPRNTGPRARRSAPLLAAPPWWLCGPGGAPDLTRAFTGARPPPRDPRARRRPRRSRRRHLGPSQPAQPAPNLVESTPGRGGRTPGRGRVHSTGRGRVHSPGRRRPHWTQADWWTGRPPGPTRTGVSAPSDIPAVQRRTRRTRPGTVENPGVGPLELT